MSEPTIALSIRQPYVEMVLRGEKRVEYRTTPTNRRGRVYLYASRIPGPEAAWRHIGLAPGDLPTGLLLGSVEIVDCRGQRRDWRWYLAGPERLAEPLRPTERPQPKFWTPF